MNPVKAIDSLHEHVSAHTDNIIRNYKLFYGLPKCQLQHSLDIFWRSFDKFTYF